MSSQFGNDTDLSNDGNRIVVASQFDNANGVNSGAIDIYEFNGTEWTQIFETLPGEAEGEFFGSSVDFNFDSNRLVVGISSNDENGSGAGAARTYDFAQLYGPSDDLIIFADDASFTSFRDVYHNCYF